MPIEGLQDAIKRLCPAVPMHAQKADNAGIAVPNNPSHQGNNMPSNDRWAFRLIDHRPSSLLRIRPCIALMRFQDSS